MNSVFEKKMFASNYAQYMKKGVKHLLQSY